MRPFYRLCKAPHADLTGEGARKYGGRHNRVGEPAVYTAEHPALAILEVMVHLPKDCIPEDYVLVAIEVDENSIAEATQNDPKSRPPAVRVPSVLSPDSFNLVIYPESKRYPVLRARIVPVKPFTFDGRMFDKTTA